MAIESLSKDIERDLKNIARIIRDIDKSKHNEAAALLSKLNQEVKLTYTKLHSLHNRWGCYKKGQKWKYT